MALVHINGVMNLTGNTYWKYKHKKQQHIKRVRITLPNQSLCTCLLFWGVCCKENVPFNDNYIKLTELALALKPFF